MARAAINGIEIDYRLTGSGPTLILIHGLACGQRMWRRQVEFFRRGHRVLTYDLRGHGRSTAPDDPRLYSGEHFALDLLALVDHLAIERAHLVGLSMGGGPAMALALRQPRRVASLVLTGVGGGAENPWSSKYLAGLWTRFGASGGIAAMAEEMMRSDFFKHYTRGSARGRRHVRALICQHQLHGITHTLEQVLARRKTLFRMRATLARIRAPTLVVTGQLDGVCHKAARLLAETIPGARELRIAGAGHLVPLEAPERFNQAVAEFIASVEAPGAVVTEGAAQPSQP